MTDASIKRKASKKRDTVGKISLDLSQQKQESLSPIELERAMQEDYLKNLIECVETNKKKIIGDFYVVVITKNERLMANVFRNYFAARTSCPTPDYDQSVFKYVAADENIQYLWTLPAKDVIEHLKFNALQVAPEERELLTFVLAFADGSLDRLAKKLNGEEENGLVRKSPLLI
jgi:hypothetical protein